MCIHQCLCNLGLLPAGLWTLRTTKGRNIQLHFLDFDVEAAFDMVEVRDGAGPESPMLGERLIVLHFLSPHSAPLSKLCLVFSCSYWKQRPRLGFLLDNQRDGSLVLHRLLRQWARIQGKLHFGRQPGLTWYMNWQRGHCLNRICSCHVSIDTLTAFIPCKQLRVQAVRSSVRQEAVSTVAVGVTVWLTVLIPLMRQTVVNWRFFRPQLLRL